MCPELDRLTNIFTKRICKMDAISREEWNKQFAEILMKKVHLEKWFAEEIAEIADDSFDDGDSPQEAVDSELSY
jgi:hypothetical protein